MLQHTCSSALHMHCYSTSIPALVVVTAAAAATARQQQASVLVAASLVLVSALVLGLGSLRAMMAQQGCREQHRQRSGCSRALQPLRCSSALSAARSGAPGCSARTKHQCQL